MVQSGSMKRLFLYMFSFFVFLSMPILLQLLLDWFCNLVCVLPKEDDILPIETKQFGAVSRRTWIEYFKTLHSGGVFITIVFLYVLSQVRISLARDFSAHFQETSGSILLRTVWCSCISWIKIIKIKWNLSPIFTNKFCFFEKETFACVDDEQISLDKLSLCPQGFWS